jgi:hypothetical protein
VKDDLFRDADHRAPCLVDGLIPANVRQGAEGSADDVGLIEELLDFDLGVVDAARAVCRVHADRQGEELADGAFGGQQRYD